MPELGSLQQILIAEDESVSRRRLEAALQGWGFSVLVARDGEQAWRLFQERRPALVVLDWMMPGLDGGEVCRRIRSEAAGGATHVILLSTRAERRHLVAGFAAGADDYLTKPFDRDELRARLRVGERVLGLQRELLRRVRELEAALVQVKQLRGLLPICSYCKKVRDDRDYWHQLESYITERTEARFSHGICPDCYAKMKLEIGKGRRRS